MKNIKLILALLASIFISLYAKAQCDIAANAYPSVICQGEAVTLTSAGGCGFLMSNDFNGGTPGAGWVATTGVQFNNPCGPGPDATYLWMGDFVPVPRTLTTVNFNVTGACEIKFWLRYSIQGDPVPCEGIDELDEGIVLQYSTNNGITWVDIAYFRPDGVILPNAISPGSTTTSIFPNINTPFTVWAQYTFTVPPAAQTPSTRFRWIQQDISALINDHWGIDGVEILCPAGTAIQWSHGPTVFNPSIVFPTSDTCFVVTVTDTITGTGFASDTVCVDVKPMPNATFKVESPICSDLFTTIQYTGNAPSSPTANYNWFFSGGQVLSGIGEGPYQVTWPFSGWQYVSLEVSLDGCTSAPYFDSVLVNLAPSVVFTADTTQGCMPVNVQFTDFTSPTGSNWYWSFGDGYTSTVQNPLYTYSVPGEFSVGLIVVTPEGCNDTLIRPNFIEVYGQPSDDFTWSPPIAKASNPTIEFFATDDPYVTSALWDFGDGNTSTDYPTTKHTFPNVESSYTVTLIVTNEYGCSDTIVKQIPIIDDELIFPNIITPNGDGINDFLVINNADKFPNNLLIVFNRWGKKVFEMQNYDNSFNGNGLAEGTYYYIFRYIDKEYHGSLTILK